MAQVRFTFDRATVAMVVVAGAPSSEEDACPVMQEWLKLEALVKRAAAEGKIASLSGAIDRTSVTDNYELLIPLVSNYGTSMAYGNCGYHTCYLMF